jgi:hypothetical protein
MKKLWLFLRPLGLVAILLISQNSSASDLVTRFGRVRSTDQDKAGNSRVSINGRTVALFEADAISLYRVSIASGPTEYVIIEKWIPGLNCHNEYLILYINEDRSVKLSPPFGECMKLEGATFAKGMASVKLRTPPSLPGKVRFETYVIGNGTVRKK